MLHIEFHAVKDDLDLHLAKRFIEAYSASHFSHVLLLNKSTKTNRFYIECERLNAFIKKDCYLIILIQEILNLLEYTK